MLLNNNSHGQYFHLPPIQDLQLPPGGEMLFKDLNTYVGSNQTVNYAFQPKIVSNVCMPCNVNPTPIPSPEPEKKLVVKGLWRKEEDEKLIAAVKGMNPVVWDVVAEKVPGRNAIQCKERWRYRLCPDVKKTRFEGWEDLVIMREQKRIGNKWTLIANKLPGRTACAVKNRWYSVLRNIVSN